MHRLIIGLSAGLAIAAVDNFAFGGEVSPIVIVGMLLLFSGAAGIVWGRKAAVAVALAWVWVPLVHVVKHAFAMPDTIHPNTYLSILELAIFSFAVSAIGLGIGLAFHSAFRLPDRRADLR